MVGLIRILVMLTMNIKYYTTLYDNMLCVLYRHLALLLILPAMQVMFYTGFVGGDVKDIKLLYDNNDTGEVIWLSV